MERKALENSLDTKKKADLEKDGTEINTEDVLSSKGLHTVAYLVVLLWTLGINARKLTSWPCVSNSSIDRLLLCTNYQSFAYAGTNSMKQVRWPSHFTDEDAESKRKPSAVGKVSRLRSSWTLDAKGAPARWAAPRCPTPLPSVAL